MSESPYVRVIDEYLWKLSAQERIGRLRPVAREARFGHRFSMLCFPPGEGGPKAMRALSVLCACIFLTSTLGTCEAVSDPAASARAAFAAGEYPKAVKLYSLAVAGHPHSAELQTDLGLAYQMEGEHQEAIERYQTALRLKDLQNTKELLTMEHCRLGEYAAALPLLKQITSHLIASDRLLPLLARCYLLADDSLDALHVGTLMMESQVIGTDESLVFNSEAYMAVSKVFIGRLMQTAGGESYLRYLKAARDSGSTDARSGFPEAIKQSPYLSADLTLDEGLKLLPAHAHDSALLYMLGVLAGEAAMKSIVDCQTRFPDSPWLAQSQARMLAAQGDPREAETIYVGLLSSHPELPDVSHELAMLYRKQGEWAKANALFRTQLAADPADDRAVTGISESLIQLGQYDEAIGFLEPRFAGRRAPLWASLDLSLAEQKVGRYSDAIDVLHRAQKAYPQDKTIHFRLMRLYTLTGRLDLAGKEQVLFGGGEKR